MTIREKVEQAVRIQTPHIHSKRQYEYMSTAAITAFLEAAAEQGWRMCRDEATEEMAHKANGFDYTSPFTMRQDSELMDKYRLMLAAGDKFEWDK